MPYPIAGDRPGLLRTAGTPWEGLGEQFLAGVREAERREDGWEAAVVGNTLLLLTQIKRATDARSTGRLRAESPELLDRICAFVEKEYAQPFTIGDLSRRFYVSESTISHLFRQELGVSLHRYVTQRRLIAAKAMICQGRDLRSVAEATGFGDYSSFYRAFRREFGIGPRRFRSLQEPG
jgi:AraC-like DNA-binding protein